MSPDDTSGLGRLAGELDRLAEQDPKRLSERVAALSVRQQAELALMLPAAQRLELMLHSPRPMRLVRSLPPSELYLTVREIGPADALPLIALASARQLTHLFDLESWRHDRFDAKRAGAWVALLLEAGEPTIRRFLLDSDDDLLVLLFHSWIRVAPIELEEEHGQHGRGMTEAGDEIGLVSPDGEYRFRPIIPEHGAAVQHLARIFFLEQRERYHQVVWGALYELPAEIEERGLKWRQSRLEEYGFPPWDEAIHVYAPPLGARMRPAPPEVDDPNAVQASRLPLRQFAGGDPLGRALVTLDDETREHVLHELLSVANHLLVADAADPGEPDEHRRALDKAAGAIRIALSERGAHDATGIGLRLGELPLLELFREGWARIVELANEAREFVESQRDDGVAEPLERLDSPLRERLLALLEQRPLYLELPATIRAFRSPDELRETRAALEMAQTIQRVLDASRDDLDCSPPFTTLLLTMLAWNATRGEPRSDPLGTTEVAEFLRTIASRRTAAPDAASRAMDSLLDGLVSRHGLDPREEALLGGYARAALERMREECASLDPGVPADPNVVTCLRLVR